MSILKTIIRRACPGVVTRGIKSVLAYGRLIVGYKYDFKRYLKHSAVKGVSNEAHLDALITTLYHVLEKGLSMPTPRPGFGEKTAQRLIGSIKQYLASGYPDNSACIQSGLSAIRSYISYRSNDGTSISPDIVNEWTDIEKLIKQHHPSIITKKRQDIVATSRTPFAEFSAGRHSIRNYADQPIDESVIKRAVEISQRSPSACNRQSTRIYSISDASIIAQVLELQNGNRGFGHLAKRVLVVAADVQAFIGPAERNQAFIDGGMFAMSLLYALHYLELGACALNWCVARKKDMKLRRIIGIHDSEIILMLITVGHIPEVMSVANSQRKPIEFVYSHHAPGHCRAVKV